jgi:hypothetical protein
MAKLKQKWQTLLQVLLDPLVLVLSILMVSLFVVSFTQAEVPFLASNKIMATVFVILISLTSAILGGRGWQQWRDSVEEKRLVARGKLAIRNLRLLFTNLTNFENAIRRQREGSASGEQPTGYQADMFDLSLMMIKEELIHAVEEWMDIIPEAQLKSHLVILADLDRALRASEKKLTLLQHRLQKTKGKSKKELDDLERALSEERTVMSQINETMRARKQILDNSILSGIFASAVMSGATLPDAGSLDATLSSAALPDGDTVQVVKLASSSNNK